MCLEDLEQGQWELDEGDGKQGFLLKYKNREVEAMYYLLLSEERGRLFVFVACFWASFACVEFVLGESWKRLAQNDIAGKVTAMSRLAKVGYLLIASWLVYRRKLMFEPITIMSVMIVTCLFVTDNAFRMTKLFGTTFADDWFGSCRYASCFDDSFFLLLLTLCTSSMPLLLSVRLSSGWMLGPWSVFIYALSSLLWGPQSPFEHGQVCLCYATMCCIIYYGSYRIERDSRDRWFQAQLLRSRVIGQQQRLDRQQTWLRHVEAKLAAMEICVQRSTVAAREPHKDDGILRTVPIPPELSLDEFAVRMEDVPNSVLASLLAGKTCDRHRLRRMAERVLDESYSMREFFEDCMLTFPELGLFHGVSSNYISDKSTATAASSQACKGDLAEYQRTIGAMFSVFWLLRLDMGGKEGFCYGCDEDWRIRGDASGAFNTAAREHFFTTMAWAVVAKMVSSAVGTSVERIEAMLALTAIHDIMKVHGLCPKVAEHHAPYRGYKAGEIINDHDAALAYVLIYYPDLLPSFRTLPKASRELVLFTQADMHFNHGWFVQAEAPPGAMLRTLKQVLSKATPGDLAFYFFHWLTDLSGAEGGPLAGAEKFLFSFPQSVLSSFLWSIPFLQLLSTKTETEVFESYLKVRVERAIQNKPLPSGPSAVALMRLVVMAQSGGELALEAFSKLSEDAQRALMYEMAYTGIAGQQYSINKLVDDAGPALFVYYGPALLQRCKTVEEMVIGLHTLAAVYHAGRSLFPLQRGSANTVVTLEAGALRSRNMSAVAAGESSCDGKIWVLDAEGSQEGKVKLITPSQFNRMARQGARLRCLEVDAPTPDFFELDETLTGLMVSALV